MPTDSLPLPALHAFEAAARHVSFTRAAEELGLTQAAVSYHVKRLEERLGAPLFARRGRSLALTEAGERLAAEVVDAFGRLRAAVGGEADAAGRILSVAAVPIFATHWLAPRLGAFQTVHPELIVALATSARLGDRTDEETEAEVEIRTGPGGLSPRLNAHRIMDVQLACVVAPAVASALRSPADLLSLPLLGQTQSWDAWFAAAGVDAPAAKRRQGPRLDIQASIVGAVASGQGAGLITPVFFAADLAAGRLVMPFDIMVDRRKSYWLTYRSEHRHSPKIRAFRDWVLAASAELRT
jgi:LysR family glycine cleavage system transcriptional activator